MKQIFYISNVCSVKQFGGQARVTNGIFLYSNSENDFFIMLVLWNNFLR